MIDNLDMRSLNRILVSQELLQVCVGQFQVLLNFDQASIYVGYMFKVHSENIAIEVASEDQASSAEDPNSSKELVCLLGKSIKTCRCLQNMVLEIEFSDNYKLLLFKSSDGYESYKIRNNELEIIV